MHNQTHLFIHEMGFFVCVCESVKQQKATNLGVEPRIFS